MEQRKCKKCQRPLSQDYQYKYCEYCRDARTAKLKKAAGTVGKIGGTALSLALLVVTKGKVNLKK